MRRAPRRRDQSGRRRPRTATEWWAKPNFSSQPFRVVATPASVHKTRAPFAGHAGPEASAALRDRLAAELKGIGSTEEAATWAHRVLAAKGTLVAADAKQIEEAFQQKLAEFENTGEVGKAPKGKSRNAARRADAPKIDKSELSHPEPRRIRDREHVRFVTKQPCLICGRTPSDPHHLRFAQHRALGRKVSDEFTVPLAAVIIARSIVAAMKTLDPARSKSDPGCSLIPGLWSSSP